MVGNLTENLASDDLRQVNWSVMADVTQEPNCVIWESIDQGEHCFEEVALIAQVN